MTTVNSAASRYEKKVVIDYNTQKLKDAFLDKENNELRYSPAPSAFQSRIDPSQISKAERSFFTWLDQLTQTNTNSTQISSEINKITQKNKIDNYNKQYFTESIFYNASKAETPDSIDQRINAINELSKQQLSKDYLSYVINRKDLEELSKNNYFEIFDKVAVQQADGTKIPLAQKFNLDKFIAELKIPMSEKWGEENFEAKFTTLSTEIESIYQAATENDKSNNPPLNNELEKYRRSTIIRYLLTEIGLESLDVHAEQKFTAEQLDKILEIFGKGSLTQGKNLKQNVATRVLEQLRLARPRYHHLGPQTPFQARTIVKISRLTS